MSSHRLKARIVRLERVANLGKFFIIDPVKARKVWSLYDRYRCQDWPDPRLEENMNKTARQIRCPVSYGAQIISNYGRVEELRMRRLYPELGKALSAAEEDEEIQLTAGYVAYYASPRGQRRQRITKLLRKQPRSAMKQRYLDRLCQDAHEDGENWPSRWTY
jgi:hypothetical protein